MATAVVVATFGDREWAELARTRAIPSAREQAPTFHFHDRTLARARNAGLERVPSPFDRLIFLDADDELEPGYVDAIDQGTADLRVPRVRYVPDGCGEQLRPAFYPRVPGHEHECSGDCLRQGNFAVVGTAADRDLLQEVGGWEEWPLYEDWAIWLRCWLAGATLERTPEAVYRAHARSDSRNRAPSMDEKNAVHRQIVNAVLNDQVTVA